MNSFIEFKNVSFQYKGSEKTRSVLNNFDLTIEKGTFTVILGHNGSGKSTIAKLMNGLNKPTEGEVLIDGISTMNPETEVEIKRRVGMVFQNPDNQLLASVVEDDVAFGPENLGCSPEESRKRVEKSLKAVGMSQFIKHAPHHLSGGQKQRIASAGVIAMKPECIVFDEPTSMLDPQGRSEIIYTIEKLNHEDGLTVVLITHFMEEAENADRVIVINDGKIVADDKPRKVFEKADYLKEIGLDVPKTTEFLIQLKSSGFNVDTNVISIEEAADSLFKALHSEGI
ncbi:MAG: energy-coupling factor transporter ATPase [Clostridia bacterium]|nr:energy-coupling factor transporter ATPase [Clostridia bacterium]